MRAIDVGVEVDDTGANVDAPEVVLGAVGAGEAGAMTS
jgi:hypothetical protein